MNEDELKYLEIIENFQHCQRNWDLEKTVDDETIDYLLEVGYNVPTKQNLNSFKIVCIKDRDEVLKWARIARNSDDTITNVGENTKQFMDKGGLQNPQTNANLLFLFFVNDKERTSTARRERERGEDPSVKGWRKEKMLEVGLAASAIGIASHMKGLRTGFCGCIWKEIIPEEWTQEWGVHPEDLAVMFGVGYPLHDDHRLHNNGSGGKQSYPNRPYEKIIV